MSWGSLNRIVGEARNVEQHATLIVGPEVSTERIRSPLNQHVQTLHRHSADALACSKVNSNRSPLLDDHRLSGSTPSLNGEANLTQVTQAVPYLHNVLEIVFGSFIAGYSYPVAHRCRSFRSRGCWPSSIETSAKHWRYSKIRHHCMARACVRLLDLKLPNGNHEVM